MAERLRGRRAVVQRKRRLQAEPLCRDCAGRGTVREASVPDHIVPLTKGGSDDDSNIRCLCADCQQARTVEHFGLRRTVGTGPEGWPNESVSLLIQTEPSFSPIPIFKVVVFRIQWR